MARMIENLENAFEEMFDFITDLPSGLDGFESDFDSAFKELEELKATLTQPNEGAKDKNVPTNEPLTLEELTLMTEPTPVWWDWVQGWLAGENLAWMNFSFANAQNAPPLRAKMMYLEPLKITSLMRTSINCQTLKARTAPSTMRFLGRKRL